MAMTRLGIAVRGVCMGAADAVPGVSGGTIALITGIYFRLIDAVAAMGPELLSLWRKSGFKAVLQRLDIGFLLPLIVGIGIGIGALSGLVLAGLERVPALVWAAFLGLVLGAVPMLIKQTQFNLLNSCLCAVAIACAAGLGVADIGLPESTLGYFVGGVLALSAMILPGLSGSFVLLIVGLYQPIFGALHDLNLAVVAPFALGAGIGLLTMTRLLKWLFDRYQSQVIAVLVGLMLGSCYQLWPFNHVSLSPATG